MVPHLDVVLVVLVHIMAQAVNPRAQHVLLVIIVLSDLLKPSYPPLIHLGCLPLRLFHLLIQMLSTLLTSLPYLQ